MVIYIVRHPETEYNIKGLTQGHKDSPLTKQGIKTAEKLGKLLEKRNISKIYSSDLGRCIQTSEIINKSLNVYISPKRELRERNHGDYNGKSSKLISQTFNMSNPNLILPNGESFNQMKVRVLNFIKKFSISDYFKDFRFSSFSYAAITGGRRIFALQIFYDPPRMGLPPGRPAPILA